MKSKLSTLSTLVLCVLCSSSARGQVVLQQPVVDQFGVNTAVSVPDRGSAALGSVSRAKDGTSTYGPFPFGSSVGREVDKVGSSVSVYIHDFEEMDRILLAQPRTSPNAFTDPLLQNAWSQLSPSGSNVRPPLALPVQSPTAMASIPPEPTTELTAQSKPPSVGRLSLQQAKTPQARLIALGDAARDRRDWGGALQYYKSAQRLGAQEADERIRFVVDAAAIEKRGQ